MSDFSRKPPPKRPRPLLWLGLLPVAIAAAWLAWHFLGASAPAPSPEPPRPMRTVTLYFAAADGSGLVAETRQLPDCRAEEECVRATIAALLAGPSGALAPILPPQARLLAVTVTGSEVQLDFSRVLIDSHPGGTLGELLTVYGLVDTVAVNFPQLRQVRLLIEGSAVETLKGHVDLRQPLTPDFGLIVTPPAEPAGALPGKS
jgi:hypothetical protein